MEKMTKINFLLTTSFNLWKKVTQPVFAGVLTAFGFKNSKPLKRLMSCFSPSLHWLKPVVNESRSACEFINFTGNIPPHSEDSTSRNIRKFESAFIGVEIKNLVFLRELSG